MKRPPPHPNGLSLLEILVAVALLAGSYAVLVTTMRGARTETTFTAEHFTAMFVAQKVIEDINQRLQENPHFFSELIRDAEGQPLPVVNGRSKYFRLLENTRDFNALRPGEDEPITGGDLYRQLEPFSVQVSTRLENPIEGSLLPTLLEVEVVVRWTSREGRPQEYRLNQMVTGNSEDLFRQPPDLAMSPAMMRDLDRQAPRLLAELLGSRFPHLQQEAQAGVVTMARILECSPGADQTLLLMVGRLLALVRRAEEVDSGLIAEIKPLEQSRDRLLATVAQSGKGASEIAQGLEFVAMQEKIGRLYQRRALSLISHLLYLENCLKAAEPAFSTPARLGEELRLTVPLIAGWLQTAQILPEQARLALSGAEKSLLSLLERPAIEVLPRRREPSLARRVFDAQKVAILMDENQGDAQRHLREFHDNLKRFRTKFDGQHPNFLSFLDREKELTRDVGTLRRTYAGIDQVFIQIRNVPALVNTTLRLIPARL
jgi:hypothetical protein